jgi:hypothetical protein
MRRSSTLKFLPRSQLFELIEGRFYPPDQLDERVFGSERSLKF